MSDDTVKKPISFSEIALALANDYDSIFIIDSEDDSYVEYLAEGDNKELVKRASGENFYNDVIRDCREQVHPEDQDHFINSFKKENVTEILKNGRSFSLNYRLIVDGKPLHYFLKTIKGSDDKVIIAVQNVDAQRRKEIEADEQMHTYQFIAGALASRYEAIYYININTNEYTQYSSSDEYAKLGTTRKGSDFFADSMDDIRKYIHKDDIDYLLSVLDKEVLLQNLKLSGLVSMTYRQLLGDDIKYVTMNIVIPKNDPDHIVMGVMDIDAQMKRELSLMEESNVFSDVAMALASRYEVIYRVNTVTNEYREYSSSDKYTKLEVGNKGSDFFADSQRNMKRDIYEEDYPMMAQAIVKERIMEQLQETNKIYINYRLNLDNRPQYVTLVIMRLSEDADHIIVALENVDTARRKEMEFEAKIGSAIDMANRDALTRVKNKHAYVNAETQLDGLIEMKEDGLEFAIAVCDINGLKQVNDEQGHCAGDKFIQDACAIICEVFDHSPVFRVGGDEFVVILQGTDYENRHDLIKRFYNRQVENRHNGLVTIAYGMAEYVPNRDLRVQDVFERADNLMYENKNRFKNQPVNEEAESIESYSFVRFYELYEQLLSAMVNFDKVDIPLIESLLCRISLMFRLSKGVTRVFRNSQDEKDSKGEVLSCFDLHIEGKPVKTLRVVSSVMTIITMTVYMSPDEEPLSPEEDKKVDLVMRTVLSFVSRNRLKNTVYELAYFDEFGYPNLRSLNTEMAKMIKTGRFSNKMAVRYNLRHFSLFNQQFGRETGDALIRTHYETLKAIMGEGGMIARLGGDNFVGVCSKDKMDAVIAFLTEALIKVDDSCSVKIATSAGIFSDYDGFVMNNPGDVMEKIISAFRSAQSGGKERIVHFDDSLMVRKQKIASVQQDFLDAIANEEFVPFYQPKVNVNTGEIIGGEALCRWFHKGRIVPPADFIPALEQTNDICKLDLYMLERVCRDQRKWLDSGEGRTLVPMSINFSRKHIMNAQLPEIIEGILDKYRIPHESIEVELTETTTDVEFSDLKNIVVGLHDRGINTSIDDFGVGFSSLNLLKGVPWHTVKIDKSFLPEEGDAEDSEKSIMFRTVVAMTKSLGFKCIAEGVETEYQLQVMRDSGCEIAQGYYYDKPLPKVDFEERLVTKKYEK